VIDGTFTDVFPISLHRAVNVPFVTVAPVAGIPKFKRSGLMKNLVRARISRWVLLSPDLTFFSTVERGT
jgi:hypothetical protein